jgi:phosphatidylinositol dimannoside acyltransferase
VAETIPPTGRARGHESAFLRRLAFVGARYGPTALVRYGPPAFGALFALALPETREVVRANLRAICGPRPRWVEERDMLATFTDYAACLTESLGAERRDGTAAYVDVSGDARGRSLLTRPGGAVLVTAHVGPWDAAAALLARDLGARIGIVIQREHAEAAQALQHAVRARTGVTVLSIGESELDVLPVLRHLRGGGLVAFQLDRAPPSARRLDSTLFGRPFGVPEGPFRLAALARVPVLPLFAHRRGYYRYGVELSEPLGLAARADRPELEVTARRALGAMERFVRAHPTQWFHFGVGASDAVPAK